MSQVSVTLPKAIHGTGLPSSPQPGQYWGAVSGARIISGTLSMPVYGAWVADVIVQSTSPLPSSVAVTIGNLNLIGSVYRQATFAGRTEARLVAGAGGWSKSVEARGYDNPGGVPAQQVLSDAATEVGESVAGAIGTVGAQFVRMGDSPQMPGKAGRVLRSVAGTQWWIDSAGVTQIGVRPSGSVSSAFTVLSFQGAHGDLLIATEDPASWAPGATFSSATVTQQTISSVRHEFRDDGVARLHVMVGSSDDWLDTIREMVRQEMAASLPFAQVYDYVVTRGSATVDALPADPTRGVPGVTGVPYRSGTPGGSATLAPGTHVGIGFLDGNPGKPVLMGAIDGTAPITESIGVTATLQLGDQSAQPLTPAAWSAALLTALTTFATAMAALTTPPLTPIGTAGDILETALGALGPIATTKVLAT